MKSAIAKHCALIATAILATGLTVNHASAATEDGEPKNVVVRYSDLDLSQPKDAQRLYARIQTAAREACYDFAPVTLVRLQQFHQCVERAVSNAVATVSSQQVTAIHEAQGRRPARG